MSYTNTERLVDFRITAVFTIALLLALISQNTGLPTGTSYAIVALVYAAVPLILIRTGNYNLSAKRFYVGLFLSFVTIVFIRVSLEPTLFDLLRLGTLLSFTAFNFFVIPRIISFEDFLYIFSRLSAAVVIIGFLPFFGFPSELGFINLSFWGAFSDYNLTIITSVFVNPNQLGFFALVGTIAALVGQRQSASIVSTLLLWINAIGLLSSHYRAGWIALLASLCLFYTYLIFGRKGLTIATVGGISSIIIGLSMAFGVIPSPESLTTTSLNGRRELWTASVHALQNSPLLGHGLSGTAEVIGNPHNSYLRMFTAFGLVGGIIYTSLVVGSAIGSSKETFSYCGAALTILLVSMLIIQMFNQLSFVGISMRSSIIALLMGYYIT